MRQMPILERLPFSPTVITRRRRLHLHGISLDAMAFSGKFMAVLAFVVLVCAWRPVILMDGNAY